MISAFCKMPPCLLFSTDTAEHVLDRKGRDDLAVRFEFGQVYNDIGIKSERTDGNFCVIRADATGFGSVELLYRDAEFFEPVFEFERFYTG